MEKVYVVVRPEIKSLVDPVTNYICVLFLEDKSPWISHTVSRSDAVFYRQEEIGPVKDILKKNKVKFEVMEVKYPTPKLIRKRHERATVEFIKMEK